MYDGVSSPLTQTFRLGLFHEAGPADLQRIEGFFRERARRCSTKWGSVG